MVQTTNAWYAVGVGSAFNNTVTPDFIANATSYCTIPASVIFNNTTLNGNTYTWDFGDGTVSTSTNPTHIYSTAGTYSVKLKANGCLSAVDSITKPAYIVINIPNNPITSGAARCGIGTVSLTDSGTSQLYWYASPSVTGTPLTIGNNYVTPVISSNSTYYVINTTTNVPVFGAATNTAIGTGGNYNTAGQYLIFDVVQASTLKSVVMYAGTAGNRTVELKNSANAVITNTIVNLAVGANTVNLNFALTPGTAYQLGLATGSAINLYRNNAGGAFPYNVGGLVTISGSSAGGGYYYFYYNWQIQKNNCTSLQIAVTATVNTPPVLTVNNPTICSGQNVNLTASAATSYTWSTGSNAASINVSPTSTSVYSLTASNGVACNSSITTTVSVNPTPTVSVNSATICFGQTANLTASGASSYSWSSGQTLSSVLVSPTGNTSYTVYGTSGSCSNMSVANVTVEPLPAVSVNSATICFGQTASLTASGATSYSWSSGQTTNTITDNPTSTTSYNVTEPLVLALTCLLQTLL